MSAASALLALPCLKPAEEVAFLVNHNLHSLYRDMLDARFPRLRKTYVTNYEDLPETLAREKPDVVLSFRIHGGGRFPRETLLSAPSLRWIHAASAGVDHLAPWDPMRLMVTNSAGIHARPMAEYATWAVLNRVLRMPLYARQQSEHLWKPHATSLAGEFSALIVGFGRIGEAIGRSLKQLGMRVAGVRTEPVEPSPAADRIVGQGALRGLLGEADFVILTLPKTPATIGFFDDALIARMKPGASLINLSRGGIVDESALHRALSSGMLGSAVIDVAEEEPLPPDNPLWDAPNIVITPHVSADIVRWHLLAAEVFADNLDRWLSGQPVINICDPRRGY